MAHFRFLFEVTFLRATVKQWAKLTGRLRQAVNPVGNANHRTTGDMGAWRRLLIGGLRVKADRAACGDGHNNWIKGWDRYWPIEFMKAGQQKYPLVRPRPIAEVVGKGVLLPALAIGLEQYTGPIGLR